MELLTSTRRWLAATSAVVALLGAGCSPMLRPEQADRGEQAASDDFLHDHLQRQPVVTATEAYRAMLLLADGEDTPRSFAAREEELLSRGILRENWKLSRETAVDRGTVAWMTCRVIGMKGGVNMRTAGELGVGDRRYAVRELVYYQLLDPGPPYRYMTGAELVDLIHKADGYMAEQGRYNQPATDLEALASQPAGQ